MAKYAFIDGERIRRAHSVRQINPIFQDLAMGLARIPELRHIKIFPDALRPAGDCRTGAVPRG